MNICNLDIGHFKHLNLIKKTTLRSLKNLPTTWGLRLFRLLIGATEIHSEKPPHHMGIKTRNQYQINDYTNPLKNLPTTWGLRRSGSNGISTSFNSEKPPHHMGIKTPSSGLNAICTQSSEKPPHHSGIIQR